MERKEKLSRKEKRLIAKKEKERKKQEKKEKLQQEKEKKEKERREKQERKAKEKLEREQKEKEKKSQKEKEKEMKRQKSRERSKSNEKGKHKREDQDSLVHNETPGVNFSDKLDRSQTPTLRQHSRLNRSTTPSGSPRSNHRSHMAHNDSPRISRSKSFQERKRDKPTVGESPSRFRSMREKDLVKSETDLLNSERNYGTLKDIPPLKKTKKEKNAKFKYDSKKKPKEKSKLKQCSASVDDMRKLEGENKNRGYHASDESFVTARAESISNVGETSTTVDDDETGELGLPVTSVFKYNPDTLTVEMGNGQFDLELLEYPHLNKDGGPISFVEDPFDYDEEEEDGKVTVPISICLIIIAGYIFAGSVLFTLWEEWDYLTGSYFCFITLSTIGFGDIVPGTDMKEWESNEKLVLCALWLAFGLSLLAMCFNLMQEEVKEKSHWLGQKLGLLRNDEDG